MNMKKGGRAKASMAMPKEGSKSAPKPAGGEVKFGYAGKARKGKKAQCYQLRGQSVDENKDYVPRSVTLADFLVVVSGFFVNIVRAVEMLASELLDLAVYNANRTTKVSRVWEQFTSDLEKMEDPNGQRAYGRCIRTW